jgi:xylose dehydrogenase (NAD/NADP)
VRVGIVGAAGIGRAHARACRELGGDVELAAVCDLNAEAAARFAEEFGVPRRYAELDAMLAAEELDVAIVATWGNTHAPLTVRLAGSGRVRAILCEKPFSVDAVEAERMQRAASEGGVLLAEAFKFRHHPMHLRARELIDEGRLGEVVHVRSMFATSNPAARRVPSQNWRFDPARGGGAINDLGCYCIHHARWVMGGEPRRVHATGGWGEASGVDEHVAATMELGRGRTAQWWVSFDAPRHEEVEIVGTRARLRMAWAWNSEDRPTAIELFDADGAHERIDVAPTYQFALQLAHLRDCLRTGQAHRIPTDDSVAQMRVMDAVRRSLHSGAAEPVAAEAGALR